MFVKVPRERYFGTQTAARRTPGLFLTENVYGRSLQLFKHQHEMTYLCVVLAGGFEEHALRRGHECARGTLIFNSAGEVHHDRFGTGGARCLNIELNAGWVKTLAADDFPWREEAVYFFSGAALGLVGRLECEFRRSDPASQLALEGVVLELLAEVLRCRAARGTDAPPWLDRVVELLHARFAEPLTLAEIAAAAGVHPAHLARTFAARFRGTVGEYLRRLRVDRAYRAILAGEQPLAAIAAQSGFSDQSHLTRVIRDFYGVTPAALRRQAGRRNSGSKAQP